MAHLRVGVPIFTPSVAHHVRLLRFVANQVKGNLPIAMAYDGFRHIHRALLPGESPPRLPTLLEQLQVLRNAPLRPAAAAQVDAPEFEEGHDEDWPEPS